jgi:hypothetical protein
MVMYTCLVCHFACPLDDVVTLAAAGHCICLRCHLRLTDQPSAMPKPLRRQLEAVMATFD